MGGYKASVTKRWFRATKCVIQPCSVEGLESLLGECLSVAYNAINYGEKNGINRRKGMKEFYRSLKKTAPLLLSCYKVAAITRACAVIRSREKSEKRRVTAKHHWKPLKPMVCIISSFFITMKGRLFIPVRRDKYVDIQLNQYVINELQGKNKSEVSLLPLIHYHSATRRMSNLLQ
jgi:hypothetical protein